MEDTNKIVKVEKINDENIQNVIEESNSKREVDYDELLSAAGEFGLYQVFLFCLTFPFYIYGVFAYYSQLFITEVSPNHWCWVPELANLTEMERRDLAIPQDLEAPYGYSQCKVYVSNWSEVLATGQRPNDTWLTESCPFGWEFNKTEIPYPTISSDLEWVCDKNSYQATAQAIFFIGSIFGGFIFGWVGDRYGRLPAAALSNMCGCVAGIISIFAQNLIQFSFSRFVMGMSYDNCMIMTYLLVLEYVAPKYRTIIANVPFAIFYTIGVVTLPWIALACGHWKTLSLATSIPMALALLAPFVIPESPRWLLAKGRIDETVNKVIIIGRFNKKEIPIKLIEQFKMSALKKVKQQDTNIIDIFKSRKLRKVFIAMCLEYMCAITVFDALVRSIGSLGFDFFLSFTLISSSEFPALILLSIILDLIGRKWLSIVALCVCCTFTLISSFVSPGLPSVMCIVIARFAINMTCNISLQWAAEMLPTPVRGSGASMIHICSYVACIVSPFISYMKNFVFWLPPIIIGILALLGALLALILPETTGIDMPQTFEEAEELINKQKMFDIPCLRKAKSTEQGYINASFEMN